MTRFRKLPVEIDAVRVNASDFNGYDWDGSPFDAQPAPDWLLEALTKGVVKADVPRCTDYAEWKIETREGAVWAGPGDWLVRGVQGEIYPCGGDIFETTYAPASRIETRSATDAQRRGPKGESLTANGGDAQPQSSSKDSNHED